MNRVLPLKGVKKWASFGLVLIVLVLVVEIFETVSSFFLNNKNQVAYLSVVSGEVNVSDGITEIAAVDGAISAGNVRTLLKTGQGIASLTLWDGSFVIIDSASMIELNRQPGNDPGVSFAFNLVEGKAVVVKQESSQIPTKLFIGGDIAVQIFQAALGLEVTTDGEVREKVDCLAGQCLVNGVYLLKSGQNAQIRPDSTVLVTDGVAYEAWFSLGKASNPGPALSKLLTSIFPMITQTPFPTTSPVILEQVSPFSGTITLTPLPSVTYTVFPSATPTPTSTKITLSPTFSLPTLYLRLTPSPTTTPAPPIHQIPSDTPAPSETITQSATPYPTDTKTAQPPTSTFTLQPPTSTFTLQPTSTPQPPSTPTRTAKPSPTSKLHPTRTPTPTTSEPPATEAFTLTPVPTDTPIPTQPPVPSETQVPSEIVPSTEVIAPTEVPLPPFSLQ